MERETGIEPATNSLEGCDSTTELLPPTRLARFADSALRRASPLSFNRLNRVDLAHSTHLIGRHVTPANLVCLPSTRSARSGHSTRQRRGLPRAKPRTRRVEWWRGKDSNLRSR